MKELKWQYPTLWSVETTDGDYYIEHNGRAKWDAYKRKGKIGTFSNLKKAKEACQLHSEGGK